MFDNKLKTLKVDKYMLERFVFGYRHLKPSKRLTQTVEYINEYLSMHEKYSFDTLLLNAKTRDSSQDELNSWPIFMYGIDKQGHIIIYDNICDCNVELLDKTFGPPNDFDKLRLYRARFMRRVENVKKQLNDKYNMKIYKHSMVFDLKNFKMSHVKGDRRKLIRRVIDEMGTIYPECVYKVYSINCPSAFRAGWTILKNLMDPITVAKTKILGEEYLQTLLKDIDIQMIPPKYGGKGVWDIRLGDCPKNFPIISDHGL